MPQNSTVTSPSRLSHTRASDTMPQDALHPVLRNALVCMDVQLEEELTRYRRQKASGGRTIAQMGRRKSAPKTLDLLDFSSPELPTQPPSNSQVPTDATGVTDIPGAEELWGAGTEVDPMTTAPSVVADNLDSELIPHLTDLEPDLENLGDESDDRPWASDIAISNHLAATSEMPDDYLESSEELLRSLAETEADIEVEQSFMQNLLTPLGLGSMLLLLVSSAIFGYVIMNPSSLSQLFATRNGNKPMLDTPTPITAPNGETTQPPEPNLAAREFPEINPANLGTLKSEPGTTSAKPTTKPGVKPASAPAARSSNPESSGVTSAPAPVPASSNVESSAAPPIYSPPEPAASAPLPDYRTYAPPARESSPPPPVVRPAVPAPPMQRSEPPAPVPVPQTVAPAPATSSATGTDAYPYKIGVPYQNDQSLEDARKVVPDAFVRNGDDGAKVQVGASESQSEAEARAQELRNQGIPAEVYKP